MLDGLEVECGLDVAEVDAVATGMRVHLVARLVLHFSQVIIYHLIY